MDKLGGGWWALQAGPGLAGAPVIMNDRNRAQEEEGPGQGWGQGLHNMELPRANTKMMPTHDKVCLRASA